MHPRKRPAAEPILPVRDPKSPRLHKIDEAADQALSARWAKVGREFAYLVIDTAWSLALLTSEFPMHALSVGYKEDRKVCQL